MLRAGSCLWNETLAVFGGGAWCHLRAPRSHRERACWTPRSVSIQWGFLSLVSVPPQPQSLLPACDRRPLRGAHAPTTRPELLIRRGWFNGHGLAIAQVSGRFTKGQYAPRAHGVS